MLDVVHDQTVASLRRGGRAPAPGQLGARAGLVEITSGTAGDPRPGALRRGAAGQPAALVERHDRGRSAGRSERELRPLPPRDLRLRRTRSVSTLHEASYGE